MKTEEEHIFLQKLGKKDKAAYNQLYFQYYRILVLYSMKYVNDQGVAEDIVQDLFISLWEQDLDFNNIHAFTTYLYNSTRNKSLNYLKHINVKEKYVTSVKAESDSTFNLDEELDEHEIYRQIYAVIETLPDRCKQVLELHLQGKKNAEIAELLELSVETVKTQKKRAVKKLKNKIDPHVILLLVPYLFE
ncbi:RNA polymerase sigma-70 factor [Plebeiibacterium marinum]|uniref:RNA polymerase sigma-70 factor n=1 Tax=Plebeiibacterium marinum TaxID=2992111 RepID=A0AAE3MGM2_9BACT|nr:RNA polymerase sigma-70 factor [Plebeiobacterium marinum]MCW3807135.1 RNA polymerase sigma-70 factor [Plebeiobacterium marinum]